MSTVTQEQHQRGSATGPDAGKIKRAFRGVDLLVHGGSVASFTSPASISSVTARDDRTVSIHKLIREGREALGLTHEEFGKLCGVSRGAVQQWEKEGGLAPNRSRQPKVAAVLSLTTEELMSGRGRIAPYSPHAMRLAQLFDHLDPERQRLAYAMVQLLANPGYELPATDPAPPPPVPTLEPRKAR